MTAPIRIGCYEARPFLADDWLALPQRRSLLGGDADVENLLRYERERGWTFWRDAEPRGGAVMIEHWPGFLELVCAGVPGEPPLAVMALIRWVAAQAHALGPQRIQGAVPVTHAAGHTMARVAGLRLETTLRRYFPGGVDASLFSWTS